MHTWFSPLRMVVAPQEPAGHPAPPGSPGSLRRRCFAKPASAPALAQHRDTIETAVPALLVLAGTSLMFNSASGLATGVVSYPAAKILRGHAGRVSWLVHALAALIVARFVLLG